MHPLYQDAEDRYQGFRDAVYHLTWQAWEEKLRGRMLDLRLLPIDDDALQQAEALWTLRALAQADRPHVFDWRTIYQQVRTTPRRFDMAIWNGSLLCGLMVGKASRGKMNQQRDSNVTIRFLQSAPPVLNELRGYIAPIAIEAAENYATLLGKRYIYVKSPLHEVMTLYTRLGFRVAKRHAKGLYMFREV
jgi:hypothetical protein